MKEIVRTKRGYTAKEEVEDLILIRKKPLEMRCRKHNKYNCKRCMKYGDI